MRIGIILVSYNTRDLLYNCLKSVFEQTALPENTFRVVVVDNGSTDQSLEMVQRDFPQVIAVDAGENLGFGRANNLGMERLEAQYGRTEYLLFLNPDTLLLNNAPGILADFLDRHPTAGAVGGNLYGADGTTPNQSFSPVHGLGWELMKFMPNSIKNWYWPRGTWFNYGTTPRQVGYISGADLMIRRSALGESPAFDPDFFMYYEDMELCVRIRRAGYGVWSEPQARIIHLEGQACQVSRTKFERLQQTKYLYYNKVHGPGYARAVYWLTQCGYRFYVLWGRVSGNREKAARYREWAEVNAAAWHSRPKP